MKNVALALILIVLVSPALASSTLFSDSANGTVGIDTIYPVNPLDIYGQAVVGTGYAGTYTAPSNGLLVEGDVGIGTSSPNAGYWIGGNDSGRPAAGRKHVRICANSTGNGGGVMDNDLASVGRKQWLCP
jgi:hypothetical protein